MKTLTFDQMSKIEAGMPCWVAKAALIAAGISFTFFTAGWGTLVIGFAGLGFAELGLLEACYSD